MFCRQFYRIKTSWIWDSWGFTKEDTDISFVAFGDNLIHEPIYRYGLQNDESFHFLFQNFKDILSQSDIAVINQETPLTDNPALYSDYPRFGTPVQAGQAIADAGFDIVTYATNHALNQGTEGINFTKRFFDSRHITCLGIQSTDEKNDKPYEILERNGIRFALFNYTYDTNGIKIPEEKKYIVHLLDDEEKIRKDIQAANSEADFIIILFIGVRNTSTSLTLIKKNGRRYSWKAKPMLSSAPIRMYSSRMKCLRMTAVIRCWFIIPSETLSVPSLKNTV